MITSIIALLIVSARTGAINAIENTYPFQIGIMLIMQITFFLRSNSIFWITQHLAPIRLILLLL